MSEEQGYIRVVNVRGDENFQPTPDEKLIMMDRSNPVLGNRHVIKTRSRLERERVIEAYRKDLEADFAVNGPMRQALLAVARDIVDNGTKVTAGRHCAGAPCHLDVVAEKVREMVQVMLEDAAIGRGPNAAPRTSPKP